MTRYTCNGKQVLRDGEHYADAVSVEAAQEVVQMRDALSSTLAALVATLSILDKTASARFTVASDKMYAQMIADYNKAVDIGRAALNATP